jgi:hypothetical protein
MQTNQTLFINEKKLTATKGLNRFSWTMSHLGAWHKDKKRRYQSGQMVKPGTYTVRLTVGGNVQEQSFEIKVDPRVIEAGVSVADIKEQTAFGLKVTKLVSKVRKYVNSLEKQAKDLKAKSDDASKAKLKETKTLLAEVKAADKIYPMPKLLEQVQYLSNQTNSADQKPGRDMVAQFEALAAQFKAINSK